MTGMMHLFQPRADKSLRPPPGVPVVYLDATDGRYATPEQFRATLDFMWGVWDVILSPFSRIFQGIGLLGDFVSNMIVLVFLVGAIVSIVLMRKPVVQVL